MRIFLAGASGVIGQHLAPLLVAEGHDVAGMTRTPGKADWLRQVGAEPVVCDVFDRDTLFEVVDRFAPDVVIHQLTDLPDDPAHILAHATANNRMRREGTTNLVDAAQACGVRVIAQSVAWQLPGDGGVAVEFHERTVLDAGALSCATAGSSVPAPTSRMSRHQSRASTWRKPLVGPWPRSTPRAA
ncbi:MAG: NAD-dependent epimerase/dehydratase family protein [Acidimicrobiales bacterium]